jgi:hypothetical protein
MRNENPFEIEGNWYKGNLHSHTTNSDGWLSPQQLCEAYRAAGYHFMAITDHGKITDVAPLSRPDFLVLSGAEYGARGPEVGSYHIVAVDIPGPVASPQDGGVRGLARAIADAGGVSILAHPYWSGLGTADMLAADECLALEVFNSGCQVEVGRGISDIHWDDVLSHGRRTFAVASDDAHHPTPGGYLSGWTMVKADSFTRESVMQALRLGRFYSSTGPALHDVRVAGDEIVVLCSPARTIALLSNPEGRGNYKAAPPGQTLTEVRFPLPKGTYLRVQVTDALGQVAWSNPFFLGSPE